MLARSKPFEALPIRGLFSGPMRVRGTAPDLEIATSLQSAAGSFSFDGRADIDSIGGYGAHGRGEFSASISSGCSRSRRLSARRIAERPLRRRRRFDRRHAVVGARRRRCRSIAR